ncbi:hypothetical protein ACI76O_01630 [Capnocytophaga cynodegmi]|uniref:hypothetical protein n=1 Tax=Capnocytophaga cynodegmi TaxID=28189 RepID=UPI001AD372C6|nr:hypothetical protein [Capnocytophaga cynodegmi]GIM51294.1 hypothetical protein CAPN004_03240 [Capnocytophaga cynodegmi]
MNKIKIFSSLVLLFTIACCKKDDSPNYQSEAASYGFHIITNGEPITGASLLYSFFDGKEIQNVELHYIKERISKEPTKYYPIGTNIKGKVSTTLAVSSSSDNLRVTLQLLRDGTVIKEDTKQGKTFTLEVSN